MGFSQYLLAGVLTVVCYAPLGSAPTTSYEPVRNMLASRLDERSDLIARMKKTMASQDTAKEDGRDRRDRIPSAREGAILLEDLAGIKGLEDFKDEYSYDGGTVSVGTEKNGSDICVFIAVGNYTVAKKITFDDAKKYLNKREKKEKK